MLPFGRHTSIALEPQEVKNLWARRWRMSSMMLKDPEKSTMGSEQVSFLFPQLHSGISFFF